MSYKQRAKYKNIKRYIFKLKEIIRFKTWHITNAGKVVIFWSFVIIFSLFFPWVSSISWKFSWRAFSKISGKPAIIILIILAFIYFSLFSIQKKEKLKLISNFYFKDHVTCILWGIFIIITSINSLNFIWGLQIFEADIISGKWAILCLSGSIIMTIGGFMMKFENSRNMKGTFIDESRKDETEISLDNNKSNMKLPF